MARELAGPPSTTLTFADDMLYVVSDRGEIALIRPNPKHLEIISQLELLKDGLLEPHEDSRFWRFRPLLLKSCIK